MRCGHFSSSSSSSSKQLEHASRSISTSSLIEDVASLPPAWEAADDEAFQHPSQTRRRKLGVGRPHPMESLADDAGSSLPLGSGQSPRAAAPEEAEELPVQAERQQPGQRRGQWRRRQDQRRRRRDWQHMSTAGESQLQESAAVCEAARAGLPLTRARTPMPVSLPDGALLAANGKPTACGAAATLPTAAEAASPRPRHITRCRRY
uniref:Uncharacterized protein n=1 Tax=Macrostomum lignano TaxID=282301 RepID=A0A1I8FKG5_9PLAT